MRTEINSITNKYRKVNEKPRKGQAELRTVLIKKTPSKDQREVGNQEQKKEGLANPNQFTKATLYGTKRESLQNPTEDSSTQ